MGRRRSRAGTSLFWISVVTFVSTLALLWQGIAIFREEFPSVGALKHQFPRVIYKGRGKPFDVALSRSKPESWVSLDEVSRFASGAVVVSEDWAFYQHGGIDARQMREALIEDLERGRFARGASTITQQVVKNVFLDHEKSLWRKLKEVILAIQLEQSLGKRRILEIYLNIAEWGEGVFGIRAAARHYFDKPPSALTAKEGAFLAMLLPSPKKYSQSFRSGKLSDFARRQVRSILGKMVQAGFLDPAALEAEAAAPLPFEFEASTGGL